VFRRCGCMTVLRVTSDVPLRIAVMRWSHIVGLENLVTIVIDHLDRDSRIRSRKDPCTSTCTARRLGTRLNDVDHRWLHTVVMMIGDLAFELGAPERIRTSDTRFRNCRRRRIRDGWTCCWYWSGAVQCVDSCP
jgi:hypothetical protein